MPSWLRSRPAKSIELQLSDVEHGGTPLEWALHGWTSGTNGDRSSIPSVVAALVERGAEVPADAEARLDVDDTALRDALRGARDR